MSKKLPEQRVPQTKDNTCPICGQQIVVRVSRNQMSQHNPHHDEWKWTPWCAGGGKSVMAAQAIQDQIEMLVKEGFVLRRVERGYAISKAYPEGAPLGLTQERLDDQEAKFHILAAGVAHSICLMRGQPGTGQEGRDETVDERREGRNLMDDLHPKRRPQRNRDLD